MDIRVGSIVPGERSATPAEEQDVVLEIARRELAQRGMELTCTDPAFFIIREFKGTDGDGVTVTKSKLYIVTDGQNVVTIHDGATCCIRQVDRFLEHTNNIDPSELTLRLIKSAIEPMNQVIMGLERYQSQMVNQNTRPEGLPDSQLEQLPKLHQTISYIERCALMMRISVTELATEMSDVFRGARQELRSHVTEETHRLNQELDIYARRCELTRSNIESLQQTVQIEQQRRAASAQEQSNAVAQLASNRFALLGALFAPPAIALGFMDVFTPGPVVATLSLSAAAITCAIMVYFRDKPVTWLDGKLGSEREES
jgi:Mg2+ and Co2+ transporter CorA